MSGYDRMTDSELTEAITRSREHMKNAPWDHDHADYLQMLETEQEEREGCRCHLNDCPFHGSIDPNDFEELTPYEL